MQEPSIDQYGNTDKQHIYDLIIIGGGISGLSCANFIYSNSSLLKYLVISPDIGGRVLMSENKLVNYGAYYIRDDYHNINRLSTKLRRIKFYDFTFYDGKNFYGFPSLKFLKCISQYVKFCKLLSTFQKHYSLLQKQSLDCSQIELINQDNYLKQLYQQQAKEFITANKIEDYVNNFGSYIFTATTFSSLDGINTFNFLKLMLVTVIPTYQYKINFDYFLPCLKQETLLKDKVTNIKPIYVDKTEKKQYFKVSTYNNSHYYAKKVVVAVPPIVAQKLLGLNNINSSINTYLFHLKGKLKAKYCHSKTLVFYNNHPESFVIDKQLDGSYLFYCKVPKPDIDQYFSSYNIIYEKFWNPAFNLRGQELLELEHCKNLFIIGDNNICDLESCYLYGSYAGKAVLQT